MGVTVCVIVKRVIKTFRNRDTAGLYASGMSRRFQKCARQAFQKLRMLDAARTLGDLSALPGNRLEALDGGAHDVEITDYH